MTRIVCAMLLTVAAGAQAQDAPRKWTVNPGQSIQEAIDKAAPGDTVQVLPGEYVESLKIPKEKQNIVLLGFEYEGERTTLKAKANEEDEALKEAVRIAANGATIEGFAVRGFSDTGVIIENSTGVTARNLLVEDVKGNGIVLFNAREATLDRVSSGLIGGAGISVNGSTTVTVTGCEAFASGVGLAINTSHEVTVSNSSIHHNWLGVIVNGTQSGSTDYVKLLSCRIMGNNAFAHPHITAPTDTGISGIGVLILGASHTEIAHCTIAENGTWGMATMAFAKEGIRHLPKDAERGGPLAEHTYAHHNTYFHNGGAPFKTFAERFPGIIAGDLYWDELGERNQWQESTELKTYPEKLVVKQGGVHTDVIHFQ